MNVNFQYLLDCGYNVKQLEIHLKDLSDLPITNNLISIYSE